MSDNKYFDSEKKRCKFCHQYKTPDELHSNCSLIHAIHCEDCCKAAVVCSYLPVLEAGVTPAMIAAEIKRIDYTPEVVEKAIRYAMKELDINILHSETGGYWFHTINSLLRDRFDRICKYVVNTQR